MKNKIISISLLIGLVMLTRACGQITAKVEVVDDQGKPVEGATLGVGFWGYREGEGSYKTKQTNAQGKASLTGHPEASLALEVTKEGYYSYENDQLSRLENHDIKVVLRKVMNPIPLYAKKVKIKAPVLNQDLGYDLKIGDWVKPYGHGVEDDIIFNFEKEVKSYKEYKCFALIKFKNQKDGIVEDPEWYKNSDFKSSRYAPRNSYLAEEKIIAQKSITNGYEGQTPNKNYLLRLRSTTNKKTNIEIAHYAKIVGGFRLAVGTNTELQNDPPAIFFTYYFNPTPNDRNLEFDPEKNLFKNLSWEEEVREP